MARTALVLCLLIAAAAAAVELPKAPEGFAWHEVPAIRAAFLVPKGWHFREERDGRTLALFITQQAFTPPEKFEVGVSISVFRQDPAAGARVKRMLEKLASAHAVELHRGSSGGPFTTLACQFESPREGKEPVRTHVMGIANAETDTVYLVFFESPASQWNATWEKGKTILGKLALETGV
jgi:hypothetical protein